MTAPQSIFASALLGMAGLAACASTQSLPRELVDARACYNRASAGPAAELAPAQLHTAKEALDRAERASEQDSESREARDLAYVAQRKAQLADSIGGSELAKQQKAQAESGMTVAAKTAQQDAEEELQRARHELAQAQSQAKEALTRLSGLKNAVKEDERGLVITLSSNVLFASGKSVLLPSACKQLDEIARALVGAKSQSLLIEGHTDATGPEGLNAELSQGRAQAVVDYLAQKGVPMDRMQAQGKGPSAPVADNRSPEGRATNRRVEIIVQGKAAASR